MGHDSAKLGQDGAKMNSFSSTWEVLGAFLGDLGRFLEVLVWLEGMLEAFWGISWAMLARRLDFSVHFLTCWRRDNE